LPLISSSIILNNIILPNRQYISESIYILVLFKFIQYILCDNKYDEGLIKIVKNKSDLNFNLFTIFKKINNLLDKILDNDNYVSKFLDNYRFNINEEQFNTYINNNEELLLAIIYNLNKPFTNYCTTIKYETCLIDTNCSVNKPKTKESGKGITVFKFDNKSFPQNNDLLEPVERFLPYLEGKNPRITPTEKNGDCLFSTFSLCIYGNTDNHNTIRQEICNYIEREGIFFKDFIEDGKEINKYIENNKKNK